MGEPVKLEQLESSEGETFRQLYAIYAASIAAREQKPEGWIAAMIGAPDYRVWVAKAGGRVQGFSILFVPSAGGFALLEYMAVAPAERNHGLGAELFRRTVEHAPTPGEGQLPVLLEVDSDREASSDRALRTRRERFYRRLGCLRIARASLPHAARRRGLAARDGPARLHGGAARPPGRAERGPTLAPDIYLDVYHCSPDDPRLAQMVADLPDPVLLD